MVGCVIIWNENALSKPRVYSSSWIPVVKSRVIVSPSFTWIAPLEIKGASFIGLTQIVTNPTALKPSSSSIS